MGKCEGVGGCPFPFCRKNSTCVRVRDSVNRKGGMFCPTQRPLPASFPWFLEYRIVVCLRDYVPASFGPSLNPRNRLPFRDKSMEEALSSVNRVAWRAAAASPRRTPSPSIGCIIYIQHQMAEPHKRYGVMRPSWDRNPLLVYSL